MPEKPCQGIDFTTTDICKSALDEGLIKTLLELWQDAFQTDYGIFRSILRGEETAFNRDILYLAIKDDRVIGTCRLTQPVNNPELGGVGEVFTLPEFRGLGIATTLCMMAAEDFHSSEGKALFLATGNPSAALIYRRLGWIKLAGALVMVNIIDKESPETFLSEYYITGRQVRIIKGTPAARIPMVPLLVTPHNWQVLDANLDLFSTRYVVQRSCMGLFPRFLRLQSEDQGSWFVAQNDFDQTVGLSSARIDGSGRCHVDGFTHHKYSSAWEDLIHESVSWAADRGSGICMARVSAEDEEKISLFEGISFRRTKKGDPFDLGGRNVASVILEKKI
jgi:GNAT superfamily N-acetyltransferase